jgi:hypothetical protein
MGYVIVMLVSFASGYAFGFVRGPKRGGAWRLE